MTDLYRTVPAAELEPGMTVARGNGDLHRIVTVVTDRLPRIVSLDTVDQTGRERVLTFIDDDRVDILVRPVVPLPPESTPQAARVELRALQAHGGGTRALHTFGHDLLELFEDESAEQHAEIWLDWAAQVRAMGYTWPQALDIARVWYYG